MAPSNILDTQEKTFNAIEFARARLNSGAATEADAVALIETSKDAVALELDERVRPSPRDIFVADIS
jgi:hypothetical protein